MGKSDSSIELYQGRPVSVAICENNSYAIVETILHTNRTSNNTATKRSELLIFKISGNSLVKCGSLYEYSSEIVPKFALECLGYVGKHILWIGFSKNSNDGFALLYDYDPKTGELRELKDKRTKLNQDFPECFHRIKGKFYYITPLDKIMSLSVKN